MSRAMKWILAAIAVIAVVAIYLWFNTAHAQVVVERPISEYDWSPVINQAIGIAVLILTGILSWAGIALRSWLASSGLLKNQQALDVLQSRFDQASLLALALLESRLKRQFGSNGSVDWGKVDLSSPLLLEAADWMKHHWPDATGKLTVPEIATSLLARIPSGEMTEKAIDFAQAKAGAVAVIVEKEKTA